MDEIIIRRATLDDAPLLSTLGARLFDETFSAANHPDNMREYLATAFSLDAQRAVLADPTFAGFIAEDAGHLAIGYAVMRRDSRAEGVSGTKPVEVQRIYSDRAWHGRGVGARLMNACIDQARDWRGDELWLAVWEKNPRAIAFYEKSGFRTVGRKTFQLGRDIQHDLVMALSLGSLT